MGRTKTQVLKFLVSINDAQAEALQTLMEEDMQENRSQYIGMLITEVYKNRRKVEEKRPVGRPKKEKEEVEWYLAPYDPEAPPYTMEDLQAYYSFRKQEVPKNLKPLTKEELKKWEL
jgi:hypothetical protein